MKHTRVTLLLASLVVSAALGCATSSIRRAHPDEPIDLSGNWNDTDANQVAAFMIHDCLSRPWSTHFRAESGRAPVIRLYPIRNRTSEHINTLFFTKQVEEQLVNSGTIHVVADLAEADDARYERADQAAYASEATMKRHQQETGTDFILNGWIVAENDAAYGREVRAYVATMELIHAETNRKVWMKAHRIKKDITRAEVAW